MGWKMRNGKREKGAGDGIDIFEDCKVLSNISAGSYFQTYLSHLKCKVMYILSSQAP